MELIRILSVKAAYSLDFGLRDVGFAAAFLAAGFFAAGFFAGAFFAAFAGLGRAASLGRPADDCLPQGASYGTSVPSIRLTVSPISAANRAEAFSGSRPFSCAAKLVRPDAGSDV